MNKKRTLAAALTVCLLAPQIPVMMVSAAEQENYTKNENVYARLDADGSIGNIYVVNAFELSEKTAVQDYGAYEEIKNLTDLSELSHENQNISFEAEKGKFYYQGTLKAAKLPWKVQITYLLDGKEIKPEELGGKSGALEIRLHTEKNPDVNEIFYENYVMQISLTLDGEKCSKVEAEGGMMADAGEDKTISYTVLPGKDADVSVKAQVEEFTMSGISIAAVPYSMEVDLGDFDVDDVTDQMTELTDAIAQLNDGTSQLNDGIAALNDAGSKLKGGAGQIEQGLQELNNNSPALTEASAKINDALNTINTQLQNADFSSMEQLGALPETLQSLSDAMKQMKTGLESLYTGFSQSYTALGNAVVSYQDGMLTEEDILSLQMAVSQDPQAQAAAGKLLNAYQSMLTVQGTYEAVKPAFDAVLQTLDPSAANSVTSGISQLCGGLDMMTAELSGQLAENNMAASMNELKNGIATLSSSYSAFHEGLTAYTGGVAALSKGYGEFNDGLNTYLGGVGELYSGSGELSDGMQQLAEGVEDVPEQMQSTIDEMMEEYSSTDFEAVSFVDERNINVNTVQFVISTEGITEPEPEEAAEAPKKEEGFWDRLLNLFRK